MASNRSEWTHQDPSQNVRAPLIQGLIVLVRELITTPSSGHHTPSNASERRMDGIAEGSLIAGLLHALDLFETFLEAYPNVPLVFCVVCAYFSFWRSLKHVALVLGLLGWFKRATLQAALTGIVPPAAVIQIAVVLVVILLSIRLISPRLSSDGDENYNGPGRPYLIPARTTHTRLVPKRHSFAYSYLLVGIPVSWEGSANGMISVNGNKRKGAFGSAPAWYNVESVEYLERGAAHLGLRSRLDNFLRSQDADPLSYPHAYFVTAPKFLGYSFNPVSFWYLYSGEKVLSAMVLEVNNTFGERRSYFVTRDFDAEKQLQYQPGQHGDSSRGRIKNTWGKDFHVSPFNSRKGAYSLMAADPLGEGMEGFRGVDVTVSLSSSKGESKIVARLFSVGQAIDPYTTSTIQQTRFVGAWFWVAFLTVPRIIAEAGKLFFKRKLHVWYRPEPLKETIGRLADANENKLEAAFRAYLRSLVEQSPSPLRVTYSPCGILDRTTETFDSSNAEDRSSELEEIQVKVLTPTFYTRFVGYAHDTEAIFCEMAESCTLWIDKPELLSRVFVKKPLPPLHSTSLIEYASFKLIKALRSRPETIKRPMTSKETSTEAAHVSDIREFRMSSMDAFVLQQGDSQLKKDYRYAVIVVFIANKFFFGLPQLLELVLSLCKLGSAWAVASMLAQASTAQAR